LEKIQKLGEAENKLERLAGFTGGQEAKDISINDLKSKYEYLQVDQNATPKGVKAASARATKELAAKLGKQYSAAIATVEAAHATALESGEEAGTQESSGILPGEAQTVANWMTERSVNEFDTYIAVRYCAGGFWTRLSGQIYLDRADFAWAAGVLLELCARAKRGDWRSAADTASAPLLEYR
jgi:hypothetical protein